MSIYPHLSIHSTAVWWQGCPLFPYDHRSMRFTSPLSSVAPSPCAGPRSTHTPSLPCSSRPCFCCCCTAWPPLWASTNCASPWWARMRARCGSITRASRNPRPWKTTCGSRWIRPGSRVETHPRGSALWWVHVRIRAAFFFLYIYIHTFIKHFKMHRNAWSVHNANMCSTLAENLGWSSLKYNYKCKKLKTIVLEITKITGSCS